MYPIKKIQQNQLAIFVNILVSISDWFRNNNNKKREKKLYIHVEDSVVLQNLKRITCTTLWGIGNNMLNLHIFMHVDYVYIPPNDVFLGIL